MFQEKIYPTTFDNETDTLREYFLRLNQRLHSGEGLGRKLIRINEVVKSANLHFERLHLPRKRYSRALSLGNSLAAEFERKTMLSLLYEIADTSYIVLMMLDLDEFDVESSQDGFGLTGDSAPRIVNILQVLERQSSAVLQLERELNIKVDFSYPVDEIEGVTYLEHPHWQNFVPTSIEKSFNVYFSEARSALLRRLEQVPAFWKEQTFENYLDRKNYFSLLFLLRRLERAKFPYYE